MRPSLARRFLASLGLDAASDLPEPLRQCPDTHRRAKAAQRVLQAQKPPKAKKKATPKKEA